MNILYLSYWGVSEGLTQSSVIPHLKILSGLSSVKHIYFLTIEREMDVEIDVQVEKVTFIPLYSKNLSPGILNKIVDFIRFPRQIQQIIKQYHIDQMICKTALGGALGYLVNKKTGTPFSVESFEPHADYMLDAKVWTKNGLKYKFQKYWEHKVIAKAKSLITVSSHYTKYLKQQMGRDAKTFGCAVDLDQFQFRGEDREAIRAKLGWSENVIGIYVGKFGDIYFDHEAFEIFKAAFGFFGPSFRLIVLTPNDKEHVKNRLRSKGIDDEMCFVDLVPHQEVPKYLSAADFAFSMVRPAEVRLYCSPIKDGEYWANGLPILSADGIGEDSQIIIEERGGAVFNEDVHDLETAFSEIQELYQKNDRLGDIRQIAMKYRNFKHLTGIYEELLTE